MTVAEAKANLPISALWRLLKLRGTPGPSCSSPFREDRKPSMSISDDKLWFDHGTGEGGDAVTFLENACSIDNAEACQVLAELALGYVGVEARAEFQQPSCARADQMSAYPLRAGTQDEITRLAALRNISPQALLLAQERGVLRFGRHKGEPAWFITEQGFCTQARRLDGLPWQQIGAKAWNLRGSRAGHPIGLNSATTPAIALVEGGPDLLAAFMFIANENKTRLLSPVAMLGAGHELPPYSLPLFRHKTVRIFPHADKSGVAAARRWTVQLHHVASKVEWFSFNDLVRADAKPVVDLNDLCYVEPGACPEVAAGGVMP